MNNNQVCNKMVKYKLEKKTYMNQSLNMKFKLHINNVHGNLSSCEYLQAAHHNRKTKIETKNRKQIP